MTLTHRAAPPTVPADAEVIIVGVGWDGVPATARAALTAAAQVVVLPTHRHHLTRFTSLSGRVVVVDDLGDAVARLAAGPHPSVLLASGDPGFFGVLRRVRAAVRGPVAVVPAPSTIAEVFAAAGVPWDDAVVVSAHGRDPRPAIHTCAAHPKVAVFTAPEFGPAELAAALEPFRLRRRCTVLERLGHPDAHIVTAPLEQLAGRRWRHPNVVAVIDPERAVASTPAVCWPPRGPDRWGLPEHQFTHREGMITKPAVRALLLAILGPGLGDLVWDVGTGSGAVAIECARFGAAVLAIDRDREALALAGANARRHGVPLHPVEGTAPEVLDDLPDPDLTIVGGGGEALPSILRRAATRTRRAIAVPLVTIERVPVALGILTTAGWEADAELIWSARARPLARGHRFAADHPVVIVHAHRRSP